MRLTGHDLAIVANALNRDAQETRKQVQLAGNDLPPSMRDQLLRDADRAEAIAVGVENAHAGDS